MTADASGAADAVARGTAHVGVSALESGQGPRSSVGWAELEVHRITEVGQLVVVPREHRLARRRRVTLADLDGERLVLPPRADRSVSRSMRRGARRSCHRRRARHGMGGELTLRLVELGSGLAIVNASVKIPRGRVARPLGELARICYVAPTRPRRREDAASLVRALEAHGESWRA